jgi:uncharacterized repeat protein (TIGR03803 family)
MKARRVIGAVAVSLALTLASAQNASLRVIHNFGSSNDGNGPSGPLLLDSRRHLYGTTAGGPGEYGSGLVFRLTPQGPDTWGEEVLHTFGGGADGGAPKGGVIRGESGSLYGTMVGNGGAADGGVFALTPDSGGWSNTVLYTNGPGLAAGPGLVLDKSGNLYGNIGTGLYKLGAIGELSPGSPSWTYTDLYNFCQTYCPDGDGQPGPPIWDGNGNLWGVTIEGGNGKPACFSEFGCGVIFEMTPNGDGTWTYHVMHRFASSSNDGQQPYGSLVMDGTGNFYGSTWLGGLHNHGTIFKFSRSGGHWKETILYDFPNCLFGCMTDGTLARDSVGNLYGTAAGGTNSCAGYSCGVVLKLAPQQGGTWKYSVLYDFSEASGGLQPFYGVILDGKGHLYGVASNFGKYGGGTAFEITP